MYLYLQIYHQKQSKHLFEYIRFCGKAPLEFIKEYLPLQLAAQKCADVFLVPKTAIDTALLAHCNDYLRDLYTSDLELDFSNIEIFSILQQVSFTSYGKDTFSTISLLVDNLYIQPDKISRSAADFAISVYCGSLQLTIDQREELIDLLHQKFQVSSHKDISLVLQRIETNLQIAVSDTEVLEENTQSSSSLPAQSPEEGEGAPPPPPPPI